MSNTDLLNILLASSVVAGFVSGIISYLSSLRLKKLDFKNEYYREILKKRLESYQFIENQIALLKIVVVGEDKKPFHNIFSYGETKFYEFQNDLTHAVSFNLWIDDKTNTILEKLNFLFFNINNRIHSKTKSEMEEIGKEYYKRISDLRMELENSTKKGLYNLHDIKKAFKTSKLNEERIIYKE